MATSIQNNRVDITLTPAQIQDIRNAFATLEAFFTFNVGLTLDERSRHS